jgi:hypothetical protein
MSATGKTNCHGKAPGSATLNGGAEQSNDETAPKYTKDRLRAMIGFDLAIGRRPFAAAPVTPGADCSAQSGARMRWP